VENYGYLNLYEVMEVGGIIILCMAVFFFFGMVFYKKLFQHYNHKT